MIGHMICLEAFVRCFHSCRKRPLDRRAMILSSKAGGCGKNDCDGVRFLGEDPLGEWLDPPAVGQNLD
jgi:hypothetical protein